MSDLICPVCRGALRHSASVYQCRAGHSFDCAKDGYVNLLLHQKRGTHGDNRAMLVARRDFLDGGYYRALAESIAAQLTELLPNRAHVLDAGCGEGYYTSILSHCLQNAGKEAKILGIDISKEALRLANKRLPAAEWAVGSLYDLPVADASQDAVLCAFSPLATSEFARVLKPNGLLTIVIPSERHLFGFKKILYDTPYENEVKDSHLPDFDLEKSISIEERITVPTQKEIQALFAMTPYYYRTPKEGKDRLSLCEKLDTEIAFEIFVYRRKSDV